MPDDLDLVERLLARYRATFREEHYSGGQWREIFERLQRSLHEVFMRGSVEEAAAILRDPASNFVMYGYENCYSNGPQSVTKDIGLLRDLARSLGAMRAPYPDAGWRVRIRRLPRVALESLASAETILSHIDQVCGGRVDFPNPFEREYGIVTSRGIASARAFFAVHDAALLRGKVLEIGAGLGRTAYYAARFGIRDYTIVDLPFTAIMQGYFLGRVLPGHTVKLLSPEEFFASSESYDDALNADSLTELDVDAARKYVAAIRARAKRFISINHEANRWTVRHLMGPATLRSPYWLRPGYVQEVYLLRATADYGATSSI